MKAIPTTYKGINFRSRLEADWAATLDDRGVSWTYEPEGYELSDGTWYSPDFYLPSARAWLEVKGAHNQRVSKLEQFAADLWAESGAACTYDEQAPMVLIGLEPAYADDMKARIIGVMGRGKKYSIGFVDCLHCKGTVVALWQPRCRGCRGVFAFTEETADTLGVAPTILSDEAEIRRYRWNVYDNFFRPFVRLPRPAGGGRR